MSANEDEPTGIPTRYIHESYVSMMQAIGQYYEAEQQGSQKHRDYAHAQLQSAVLEFYETLRPYLRTKDSVEEFWQGEPPDSERDTGTAVLASQTKRVPIDTTQFEDGWQDKSLDWLHEHIEDVNPQLNGNSRIADMHLENDVLLLKVNQYQTGLQHLDGHYKTTSKTTKRGSTFMRSKTETSENKRKMPIEKVFSAAHALEEAAETLDLLSPVSESVPQTEITEEMIDEVDEWIDKNLDS